MEFLKTLVSSFLTGRGRSTIAVVLAMALMFGLIGASAGDGADRRHCGRGGGRRGRQP